MAEMTAQEAAEWGKTLDFPTVWASLTKMGERVDETTRTVDKLGERVDETTRTVKELGGRVDQTTRTVDKLGERVDETTRTVKELGGRVDETTRTVKELGGRVDETTRTVDKLAEKVDRVTSNVGGLNNSMGELVETLFAPHLGEKFDAYDYNLRRIFRRVNIYDDTSRQRGEIDILLSNTTVCMAVEVKRWLDSAEKVDEHIRRMQLMRKYPPAETKGKKLLGAIAAAVVSPDVREYAEQSGFFVLELTGEDVHLLEPPKDFQPKEW